MAMAIACDIHPLNNLRVLKYLKNELGHSQEEADAWYAHWISEGLPALEAMAAPRAGKFLFGDAPTPPTSAWSRSFTMRGGSTCRSRLIRPCCGRRECASALRLRRGPSRTGQGASRK